MFLSVFLLLILRLEKNVYPIIASSKSVFEFLFILFVIFCFLLGWGGGYNIVFT